LTWIIKTYIKGLKKIKKQKNKDEIEEKIYVSKWNWMMKLKADKTFTRGPRRKFSN
jgi:hypothetical protein